MDALIVIVAVLALAVLAALWWTGRLGDVATVLGAAVAVLLALAVTRPSRSRPPTPPTSAEPDAHRSAGRRLDEAREVRAPTTDPDADARAAADRLNRRHP